MAHLYGIDVSYLLRIGQVGLFSLAVAALIWWLADVGSFMQVLLVSLSIGWSIYLAFFMVHEWLTRWLGPWLSPALVVMLGLLSGMMIGGMLVAGQPLLFFSRDFFTMGVGLFFGITGFLIFSVRERLRETRQQLSEANLKEAHQEKLRIEAELKLLQAQIEPHFLFNTLSNITHLVRSDPDVAVGTLENLTVLLRGTLARTRSGDSTFGQEIEIARAYLAIQATRMQGRLRYRYDFPEEALDVPMPALLIQPLLENAVIHGIEPKTDGGEIVFTARLDDDELLISVCDNGIGMKETGISDRTGLRNVRERLKLVYGASAKLELMPGSSSGVNACIHIPVNKSWSAH